MAMPTIESPLDWEGIGDIGYPDSEYADFGFHDLLKDDIASFLRIWLFFGLLKEVLGEGHGSLQHFETEGRIDKAKVTSRTSRLVLTEIFSGDDDGSGMAADQWNKDVPLALMVLGEMLTNVRIRGWRIDESRGWGQNNTVRMLQRSLHSHKTAQLYALRLTGPVSSQPSTLSLGSNGKGYEQAHKFVGLDQDKLADIIERGRIPLAKYNASTGRIKILEFEPGTRYVIISHKKIRKCVLDLFNQLILDAQQILRRNDPDPELPFWIDALTIPVNNPIQRKRAIKTMHYAYTNANFMVVLDSGLAKIAAGRSYAGTAMRIFTSQAYLSKKLIFRFSNNELVDMDQLEANFLTTRKQKRIYGVPVYDSVLLASVWEAVQWRTTSFVVHETQALATLFEVEVDFPDDFDHASCGLKCGEWLDGECRVNLDMRMKCFLESLYDAYPGSIPPGIIFVPGRRLAVEGFGWALCSWMVGQNVGHDDPIFSHKTAAELTLDGLLVRYSGFQNKFAFPCDILLLEWYCVQSCDGKTMSIPKGDGHAIISSREEVREDKSIALLVSVKKTLRPKLYTDQAKIEINQWCIGKQKWDNIRHRESVYTLDG
ncbi:hypothetical protein EDB82DRAFT_542560 [Fusarium venenatum]|uniref:uncharacterized protein n=1 Tax=Fusarium venenatum TaxID=56646 RepID=UPI001D7BC5CE|nr:hypothetical protein EDB82DRAFT_542560 [Fusarium venenatum]